MPCIYRFIQEYEFSPWPRVNSNNDGMKSVFIQAFSDPILLTKTESWKSVSNTNFSLETRFKKNSTWHQSMTPQFKAKKCFQNSHKFSSKPNLCLTYLGIFVCLSKLNLYTESLKSMYLDKSTLILHLFGNTLILDFSLFSFWIRI